MAIIVTPQKEIDAYFNSDALSQSTLKSLLGGFDKFMYEQNKDVTEKELYYQDEKGHFSIGSAVDTILTGEDGEYEKQYYVSSLDKKPSEVEMSIVNEVFDEIKVLEVVKDINLEDCRDAILTSTVTHSWRLNMKDDTRVDKLIKAGTEYFEDLKKSAGKQVLSSDQHKNIDTIVKSLRSDSRTAKYFNREVQAKQDTMDFYYQLPIYFTFRGVKCKALMDLIVVFKDAKGEITHIEPYDLKTMSGNTLTFLYKLKQHRYDIQAAWYTLALEEHFKVANIKPFSFIVESSTNPGRPLVYELNTELQEMGRSGRTPLTVKVDKNTETQVILVKEVIGYNKLLQEYIYYLSKEWKQDKVLDDNPGKIKLSWEKIL